MALLHVDSFDHYATADLPGGKYTQIYSGPPGSSPAIGATGRRSTNGVRFACSGSSASKPLGVVLPASGAVAICGFSFKQSTAFSALGTGSSDDPNNDTASNTPAMVYFRQNGTTHVWFKINTSGQILALRGSTVLGTSSLALTQSVEQYIEFKVTIDNSAGTVDVLVDGVSFLSLTGQDTQNGGSAAWDEFAFGHCSSGASSCTWDVDDLYVCDGSGSTSNDFLGDVRLDAVFPNADGTHSDFTRSTGTDQYATVDEASANGDTDYNESATINAVDTLNFPNAPVAGATILAVQVMCQVKKSDAGTAGHKAVTRIGGTDYAGSQVAVTTLYAFLRQIWDRKPSDSTPWTDTDFNAAEFGYSKSA